MACLRCSGRIKDMNDAQIDDLKQYISAEDSQSSANAKDELKRELGNKIDVLRTNMNDGFAAIGAIFTSVNDSVDDHEARLVRLEQQTIWIKTISK